MGFQSKHAEILQVSLCLLLLALSNVSNAEVVTWEATGYVTSIKSTGGWITEFPNAVVGSPITLRVNFDTSSPLSQTTTSADGNRYRYFGAVTGYELIVGDENLARPLDTALNPFVSIMDNYNVQSPSDPAQDGFGAVAYVHSTAPGSYGQVGLVIRGPEYLNIFNGPGLPTDPSPLLTALSTHVIQFLDGTDWIIGEVTSIQRVSSSTSYVRNVTIDLSGDHWVDRADFRGNVARILFVVNNDTQDRLFEEVNLLPGDSLVLNIDFLGDQRLTVSNEDGTWRFGTENISLLLYGSGPNIPESEALTDVSLELIGFEGETTDGGAQFPVQRERCGSNVYCVVSSYRKNITDTSFSFSGMRYRISDVEIVQGPAPFSISRVAYLQVGAQSVEAQGDGSESSYALYPLGGPGTTTVFPEDDKEIPFVLYRSQDAVTETVYVSTLQSYGSKNVGDYLAEWKNEPVTFAAGQDRVSIVIRGIDDSVRNEDDEKFGLVVEDAADGNGNVLARAAFTIEDNDVYVMSELKAGAVEAALSAKGAPYLGDGSTWGGKGWDWKKATNVSPSILASGYTYFDKVKEDAKESDPTSSGAGVDCSGLVQWSYNYSTDPKKKLGIMWDANAQLLRTSYTDTLLKDKSKIEPGDLMFFNRGGGSWTTHVAMYVGNRPELPSTCGATKKEKCNVIEAYCGTLKDGYCKKGLTNNKVLLTNLNHRMTKTLDDKESDFDSFGKLKNKTPTGIQIRNGSPIDLIVTDPDGVVITPHTGFDTGEEYIRGVGDELFYTVFDRDSDGTPKSMVYSPVLKPGNYIIRAIRRHDALPGSTYSLNVVTDNGTLLLADDEPIDALPINGYGVTIADDAIEEFVPQNMPATADAGPAQVAECSSPNGARVILDASASSDLDGDPLTFHWTGPFDDLYGRTVEADMGLGVNHVVLTVDDGKGGADSTVLEVTVLDTTAPDVSVSATPDVLWPPNHKMIPVSAAVTPTDACDVNPSVELISITSSEGNTANDVVVDGEGSISLRAERNGKGPGRIYTITYSATDISGNTAEGSATVSVPHDQKKKK